MSNMKGFFFSMKSLVLSSNFLVLLVDQNTRVIAQEASKMNVALLCLVILQTILTKKFKLDTVAERDVILTFHGSWQRVAVLSREFKQREKSH